jgi:hypothetical protein
MTLPIKGVFGEMDGRPGTVEIANDVSTPQDISGYFFTEGIASAKAAMATASPSSIWR